MTRVRAQEHGCLRISSVENPADLVVREGIAGVSVVGAYRFVLIIVQFITLSVIHLIAVGGILKDEVVSLSELSYLGT